MKKIALLFSDSLQELRKTRSLAVTAMLLAIAVILGFLAVQVTESIKISFAFLVDELVGMLFGPAVGAVFGAVDDFLKYIVKPTGPYFPGFMISEMLTAMIYGLFLYKRPIRLTRIIAANTTVTVFVNMLLNTLWLTMLYGSAFAVIFPARVVKELVLLPVNIAMFYILSRMLEKAKVFRTVQGQQR